MSSAVRSRGRISAVRGTILEAELPHASVGDFCEVSLKSGRTIRAEVISFERRVSLLSPFDSTSGIMCGDPVLCSGRRVRVRLPRCAGGIVMDAFGNGADTGCSDTGDAVCRIPSALSRKPISDILETGISSIDSLCTLGIGQRIGIFSGPGSGKSSLLAMLARNTTCDVCVTALIGERGREVAEFVDRLGSEGRGRTIVVAATSDEPPLRRILAANTATALAEEHRRRGKSVLLLFDSLTRYARAARDLYLSVGEIPVRHGYPPSLFATLPTLIERTGNDAHASISAVYTVLSGRELAEDPLGDEIKGLLDGHLVLSDSIAESGIRPAIDITRSISRLSGRLVPADITAAQLCLRRALFRLTNEREILQLGALPDAELVRFSKMEPAIRSFLDQREADRRPLSESFERLSAIASALS